MLPVQQKRLPLRLSQPFVTDLEKIALKLCWRNLPSALLQCFAAPQREENERAPEMLTNHQGMKKPHKNFLEGSCGTCVPSAINSASMGNGSGK
jgi:hypothetical protein